MKRTKKKGPIDFDEYADYYEDLLSEQLNFFNRNREYFSEYKVALAAANCRQPIEKILDFGCGIGLSLPYLQKYFCHAQLFATDISEKSLSYVRDKFVNVTILKDDAVDDHSFDMIFVTGVFHHLPVRQRSQVMERLSDWLISNGKLFVFEHNPYNPVTQHLVSSCPFDRDVELISLGGMKQLVKNVGRLEDVAAGYCLFFPQILRDLRPLEKFLRWLPLGGQYFVVGSKKWKDRAD